MGFEYKEYRRGVYFDGHERDDVVDYRKEFLDKMKELVFLYINLFGIVHLFSGLISIILFRYERLMPLFEGEDLNIRTYPDISSGESLHILVTHDESLFHANDGRKSGWGPENEQPLRKKGQGHAIHVSEFLCETIGRLKLSEEQQEGVDEDFPTEARVIIHPGKGHDGFWNVEQLLSQVKIKQSIL